MNAIATALDAIGAVVPGPGGGGTTFRAAMAVAPASAAAVWRTIPAAAKQRVYAEVAKTLGWSTARAIQMTNAFFSAMNAEGGGGSESSSSSGSTGDSEVRQLLAQGDPVVKAAIEEAQSSQDGIARVNALVRAMKKKPAVPESFTQGEFFARGGTSNLYKMEGHQNLLIKPGGGRLPNEARAMVEMEMIDIPTVYVKKTTYNEQNVLILQKIEGVGSKDIIGRVRNPVNPPQNIDVVTQKTIDDLEQIYSKLQQNQANIGDFQFIIRKSDGAVFVNDPVSFTRGKGPSGDIRNIINRFKKILKEKNTGGQ